MLRLRRFFKKFRSDKKWGTGRHRPAPAERLTATDSERINHKRQSRDGPDGGNRSPELELNCDLSTMLLLNSEICPSLADKSNSRKGLVSIDRSEVAALLSTTPRPKPRSSTNDLASPLRWDGFAPHTSQAGGLGRAHGERTPFSGSVRAAGPRRVDDCRISASRGRGKSKYRHTSGQDSGLEAFSRNPPDGSLAPSAYRPSA